MEIYCAVLDKDSSPHYYKNIDSATMYIWGEYMRCNDGSAEYSAWELLINEHELFGVGFIDTCTLNDSYQINVV